MFITKEQAAKQHGIANRRKTAFLKTTVKPYIRHSLKSDYVEKDSIKQAEKL
jgi:hypothetical protein